MAGKELIQVLLDEGSLLEMDASVRCGVLTGLGTVQNRPLGILVFEKDVDAEKAFDRAGRLLDKVLSVGAPLLMIFEEGADGDGSDGMWRFLHRLVRLSGVCPLVTLLIGSAGTLAKTVAPYADFCIRAAYASSLAGCTLIQSVDLPAAVEKIRTLVSMLPSNCAEDALLLDIGEEMNRLVEAPGNAASHMLARQLADFDSLCALYEDQHALVALTRIGGRVAGVIAAADETLPADISRFVRFCDCYSLPLVWVEDGKIPMQPQLVYALSEATIPKVLIPLGCAEHAGEAFDMTISPAGDAAESCADDSVNMQEMRRILISALEMFSAKRDVLPPHKHGNLPLGGMLL